MARQIFIGLVTEGTTDVRFFRSIVERTFFQVAYECCKGEIEVIVEELKDVKKGDSFTEFAINASLAGIEQMGAMTIVIHADSDVDTYKERFNNKFQPAIEMLKSYDDNDNYCHHITPLIPVKMMEAWMLADKELFKSEINTKMTDSELGIARNPESIADPKTVIEEAIRISTEHLPKRRHRLSISDLYGVIGAAIPLEALSKLTSYKMFKEEVYKAYAYLNYV